ncbi:MAG: phosphatase PAP2 family protein [Alphaproteobacteria bacterium]|nr:phosphatase PAP2 family protein [Alphaproteobacteria bacterium]MBL6937308.1 phosphatase PAP2 family protein [Alphaproteobacteria bacterium]MBL7096130.1 phosphatase PAP2 family protein [Alphaproteobacteria bacterium]
MFVTKRLAPVVLAAGLALADPAAAATAFVSPAQVDASRLLAPPPAAGSPRALAEMAELRDLIAHRTPDERELATHDAKDETGGFFASAIGPAFDLAKLPKTAEMLADIGEDEDVVTKPAKAFFHRDRPYTVAPELDTCTPHKDDAKPTSYPSGHATRSFAMGVVLVSLMPDKAQAILARSAQYAEERLICGVHFRSDIVAGQTLGTVLGLELMRDPGFRKVYDAAADELKAAHLR